MEEGVYTLLAFQIRALREQREWSQKKLGRMSNMAQERVSILEDPNAESKPTLNTLLRLAAAFDVGLDVRFVPFSKIIDGSFNNTPIALQVPGFEEELQEPEKCVGANDLLARANSQPLHSLTGLSQAVPKHFTRAIEAQLRAIDNGVSNYYPGGVFNNVGEPGIPDWEMRLRPAERTMTLVTKYNKLAESKHAVSSEDPYEPLRLVPKPEVTEAANQREVAA